MKMTDPFAQALLRAPYGNISIIAQVGEDKFYLHHWSLITRDGKDELDAAWTMIPCDSDDINCKCYE